MRVGLIGLFVAVLFGAAPVMAQPAPIPPVVAPLPKVLPPLQEQNGLALTPPMGWNSWNNFKCNVDEQLLRRTADAMVASGMRDAGYKYVVIDDCWQGERDKDGFIQPDAKRFPSGMKALGDYLHARGLKFGIYSDAGSMTCQKYPGSQGHEYQDAIQYARWGVDYLKYDWCFAETRNPIEAYTLMSNALRATGRDIIFSICEWGTNQPWTWGKGIGNLWRTTFDIWDSWEGLERRHQGVMEIVEQNEPLASYAGPGHWNDPDMLEVGNGGLNAHEARAHFSLWAMMAAPLIAGNDVTAMSPETAAILTNRDVIAVDQDPLGRQGRRVRRQGEQDVWLRELANGRKAVLLLNRADTPAEIAVQWRELAIAPKPGSPVRDLWTKAVTKAGQGMSATVPAHGVVMLLVEG